MAKNESEDISKSAESETKVEKAPKVGKKDAKRIEELEAQLAASEQKAGEYLELAQHMKADLENYRRRVEKENEDRRKYAALDLVKELLNVADDLGRALEHANPEDPVVSGVKGVSTNLGKILENQGVKEIPTEGKFDPNFHEALTVIEADEDDKIAMVAQKGYTMHGKVIRYAKVVVTRKKEEPAAPAPEEGPAENAQN